MLFIQAEFVSEVLFFRITKNASYYVLEIFATITFWPQRGRKFLEMNEKWIDFFFIILQESTQLKILFPQVGPEMGAKNSLSSFLVRILRFVNLFYFVID